MFQIDLNHPDISALQKAGRLKKFKKGEIIIRPYDDVKCIYVIVSGIIKSYTINKRGEEFTRIMYGEDEFFPLSWIANRARNDVFYGAVTDCEVFEVPRDVFTDKITTSVDITHATLVKVIEQYTVLVASVDNLEYKYARERLAFRLLMIAARFGDKQEDGSIVLPVVSQQDLGSAINLTRESVSRELARFERHGYISITKGRIKMLDTEKMSTELDGNLPPSYEQDL
jgi:CRP/FNR family transcriptional regulator